MKNKSKKIFIVIFLVLSVIAILSLIYFFKVSEKLYKEIDLSLIGKKPSSITRIYYYDKDEFGNPVGEPIELKEEELFLSRNEWISYYNIPKNLVNAFIAIEDQHFFEHKGVDWPRTIKATFNYLRNFGKSEFGGSTITQQLVKNITGDNKQTPKRKIEEIIRALNIEKNTGKFDILELYLNIVYLSNNCYGVNAAAKTFFGKEIDELTLAECASIASIVKSPSNYDPYHNPVNNKKRREIVLKRMYESGMITNAEYNEAKEEEIIINSKIESESKSGIYSWYTECLIDDIISDLKKKYNISEEAAQMLIYRGGLNIYTPIEPRLQNKLEKVFENYKAYIDHNNGTYPEASCVILNPYTSDIVAIAGGVGHKNNNRILNRAKNIKRPLGSVIKPLSVYTPLIDSEKGNYATVFDDTPIVLDKGLWPKNSPNIYHGLSDLEYSVTRSLNTVAVKALDIVGKQNAFDFLKEKLKFKNLTKDDLNSSPLALGQLTEGESLLTVTNAYSMFQNGGYILNPRSYYEVKDSFGNVLLKNECKAEHVISESTAAIMNIILSKVVSEGTAKGCELKNYVPVAGKTGTSGNNQDKWFIGYTSYYTCGVWVGYDTPAPIISRGNNPAIRLFDAVMSEANINRNPDIGLFFDNNVIAVEYCIDSGMLPCDECRLDPRLNRIKTGYFVRGTEPIEKCNIHKSVYINVQTGELSNESTSYLLKRKIALLDYIRGREFDEIEIKDRKYTLESRISK